MSGEAKISGIHGDGLAAIYLRQSSMAQVRQHTESTMRQYGLAEEAVRLGWARPDVLVIDTDLGVSGRWGVVREGVTELGRRGGARGGRAAVPGADARPGPPRPPAVTAVEISAGSPTRHARRAGRPAPRD